MRRTGVLLVLLLVGVVGLSGPAAAVGDECVKTPIVGLPRGEIAEVSTGELAHPIGVRVPGDWLDCSGLQISVQKTDGSMARTLPLDMNGETGAPEPPVFWKYGDLKLPLANGPGEWVVTKVSRASTVLLTNVRFRVYRADVFTLEPPVRTSGLTRTPITGVAKGSSLQIWDGKAWQGSGSANYVAANGTYQRYWKPTKAGTYRLRVVASGPLLDNSPWSRELTLKVVR